ncbi:hypothetical protein PV394_15890 [Streptomyces sp. NE06-03E]|uniref:Uncharacterized protein n=1 Tax=Streptomyces silvae TaxID=2803812 RepID=A0ABU8A9J5_9ACTN|nr:MULTISPECIES: hypothetical protein [unclassified Streptomyces]MDX3056608.1 hypothetical protein [Streptomyces sp. NE06-03E]MDX3326073.1 hypothetical protein [Streptomyces sp. ME02-6979-3A]MDX3683740.1 hypothetical protein [Streptomyces sp. AK04-4c]
MTTTDRTPADPGTGGPAPGRLTALTGLVSVVGAVLLAVTGHAEAAAAAGLAGGAVAGGIHVTVNIQRRPPGQE